MGFSVTPLAQKDGQKNMLKAELFFRLPLISKSISSPVKE
jgi:hypothetical protein